MTDTTDTTIETIFATELSFYNDLRADIEACKIVGYATFAAKDADGHEAVRVWLPDGIKAIADGTLFAESDWEECGRLEVHAADLEDELDRAALEA